MRIIIFSDTHLSHRFDEKKFHFLVNIIKQADQVIINGDFWDYYRCDFNHFVNSRWKQLFPLLLKKKTIYIYGNHDRADFCDHRVNLFSAFQSDSYLLTIDNKKIHIEHGHQFIDLTFNDSIHKIRRFRKTHLYSFFYHIIQLGNLIFGPRFNHLLFFRRLDNKKIKNKALGLANQYNISFVLSHTHEPELHSEHKYFNTGEIMFNLASFIKIEDNKLELIKTKY